MKPDRIGSTLDSLFEELGETTIDPAIAAMAPWEIVRRCRWTPEERAAMNAACTCQVKDGWDNICQGYGSEWSRLVEEKRKVLAKRRKR